MKKLFLALTVFTLVLLPMVAMAYTISYVGTSSLYSISVSGNYVYEDYNAKDVIPFPSHDGGAVVDLSSPNPWFDKKITISGEDQLTLFFEIKNTSPYTWSDYHLIFSDAGQTISGWNSLDLTGVKIIGNTEINFYYDAQTGSRLIGPGENLIFDITLNTDDVCGDIKLRQIATTAPIPGSLLLLGSGVLGLIGLRRKL